METTSSCKLNIPTTSITLCQWDCTLEHLVEVKHRSLYIWLYTSLQISAFSDKKISTNVDIKVPDWYTKICLYIRLWYHKYQQGEAMFVYTWAKVWCVAIALFPTHPGTVTRATEKLTNFGSHMVVVLINTIVEVPIKYR